MRVIITLLFILCVFTLKAEEQNEIEQQAKIEDIAKISEAFGHLIGKNLQNTGFQIDVAHLIKGLQDAAVGLASPMNEQECMQALTLIQERWFKEQSEHNLKAATAFLETNAKRDGIYLLNNGRVQYRIDTEGTGEVLEEHCSPLVRYTGKFLDGSHFTDGSDEEKIHLDEIIPGLKEGLMGMREGEKRTIYIHPDLAYGVAHFLPPNSLLTFEVELIKTNASAQSEELPSANISVSDSAEIAEEVVAK